VKVIIFDFDGTIADSFETFLQITNRLSREFGYKPASPEEVQRLQNLNSREILRQSQIPLYKLPFIIRRLKQEMSRSIGMLSPIPGIPETLMVLKSQGYVLGIVTSNTQSNVAEFLDNHKMQGLFDFLHSSVTLFGKGRIIERIIRQQGFDPNAVIYVGDETRDIEAARNIHIKVIAVGWGFNSAQALSEEQPDCLVREPGELIGAIAAL
jgi:phosphoglycolate phosphatase